jgi:23S rRNA pseudouridine1911/1915/1917 synthase
VTPSQWIVGEGDAGQRLDKFLAAPDRLGSRGRVTSALERGKVFLNEVEATTADAAARVSPGDRIRFWPDRPGSAARRTGRFKAGGVTILYEDASLIVLDKPAGILTVPLERRPSATTAYGLIDDHLRSGRKARPLVVHRIDLDTSGLVVFAKDARAQAALRAQFKRREPSRVYLAVVYGHPEPDEGLWRDRIVWDDRALVQKPARPGDQRAMDAISRYRVLERFDQASLIEVRLHTGKRNQIRIQAQLHGHPLVGERRYVDAGGERVDAIPFGRQALHAQRLTFDHPETGERLTFEAPVPRDLADLIRRLRR